MEGGGKNRWGSQQRLIQVFRTLPTNQRQSALHGPCKKGQLSQYPSPLRDGAERGYESGRLSSEATAKAVVLT